MNEYYLKNSTGSEIDIDDLGIVISDGQSITIDINDIGGYLSADMIAALNDNPANGLILSTTDVGDTSGDFIKSIAIERLTLKTRWKPGVATFAALPINGNEDGDLRLITGTGIIYRWSSSGAEWIQTTSTFSLTVTEYDNAPLGEDIEKLVFVQVEDNVYIDTEAGKNVAYIGPPNPPLSMSGQSLLTTGTSFVTGGLSDLNINYKPSDLAGSVVNYITKDSTLTISTPTGNYSNYGDRGVVKLYVNGVVIASIDLGANFNIALRDGSQVMNNYDVQGVGSPMSNGIVSFTGGTFQVNNVQIYGGFRFYQRFQVSANITDAAFFRQGYNSIYITHEGLSAVEGGTQTSETLNLFYDIDTGSNPSVSTPIITELVPVFKYLSGVKFYDTASTWEVDTTASNCFNNVYHSTGSPVTYSGWPGLVATDIRYDNPMVVGVSNPPKIGETMSITNWVLGQVANQMASNARITATPRDPYSSYTAVQSSTQNILVWSYPPSSTNLIEHFRDEDYRLPIAEYNTIPATITGQWDSTQSLDTYNTGNGLQVYLDELYAPTLNFSTYMPSGNPNYSLIASESDKVYIRAFKDTTASHASGTLRITGLTKTQLYNRNVKIWIKAPTQTGWLDLTRDYNFSTFSGIDNDGCWVNRDVQSTSDFKFTLGTNYTVNSGGMIIVKVQYPDNTAPRISYMSVVDW